MQLIARQPDVTASHHCHGDLVEGGTAEGPYFAGVFPHMSHCPTSFLQKTRKEENGGNPTPCGVGEQVRKFEKGAGTWDVWDTTSGNVPTRLSREGSAA